MLAPVTGVVMNSQSAKIDRIRGELRRVIECGHSDGNYSVDRLRDMVSDLTLYALGDKHHPLRVALEELEPAIEAVIEERKQRPSVRAISDQDLRDRLWFQPMPGTSAKMRRFWQLQLLLLTAARSTKHRKRLVDYLQLSSATIVRAADAALHVLG